MDRRQFIKLSSLFGGGIAISTQLTGCGATFQPDGDDYVPAATFTHGVASGDPTANSIILWTRAVPENNNSSGYVRWQLATSPDFAAPIRSGVVKAERSRDFTVKVDVRDLPAGQRYYYRFFTSETRSPTGQTLTLDNGVVDRVKFAVFSCANFPAGYFNAYDAAAKDNSVDVVLHLGDYIYEYPKGGYATANADAIGRSFVPGNEGELLNLTDYRTRYAQYRGDKGLQLLHQRKPFIAVWDDHEIANDTFLSGAENHNEGEGDFFARRTAAIQAYYEWLPIRPPMGDENPQIYRYFEFGNLVSLYMLDTRVIGRDEQLSLRNYKLANGSFDFQSLQRDINDPARTLLGSEQFNWLKKHVASGNNRWHVLGQQILMGKMHYPAEIIATTNRQAVPGVIAELMELRQKQLAGQTLTREEQQRLSVKIPYNLDAWDGYAAERDKVLKLFSQEGKSLVVLAGDTHNGWANTIADSSGNTVAVEYGTPGVTSPGFEGYLGLTDKQAEDLARALPLLIDEVEYCNLHQRGYMSVEFTLGQVNTAWHYVSNIKDTSYTVRTQHRERFVG